MNKQSLQTALLIAGLFMVSGCLGKHEITEKKDTPVVDTKKTTPPPEKKAPTAPTDITYDPTTKELKWTASTDEDAKDGDAPITYYIYGYGERAVAEINKDPASYKIADPKDYHNKVTTNSVVIDWNSFKNTTGDDYFDFVTIVILAVDKDGMRALSAPTEKTVVTAPVNGPSADTAAPTAPSDIKFDGTTMTLSFKESTDETTKDSKKMKYHVYAKQDGPPDTSAAVKPLKIITGIDSVNGVISSPVTYLELMNVVTLPADPSASVSVTVSIIAEDEAGNKSPAGTTTQAAVIPRSKLTAPPATSSIYDSETEDNSPEET